MPIKAERAMMRRAKKMFPKDRKRQDAYVYGGMQHKTGWKPKHHKHKRGKR